MVAFGKKLKETQIQEWQRYYINYKLLKKKVKQYARQIEVGDQDHYYILKDFSRMLDKQLKKKSGNGKRIDRTVGKMGAWKAINAPQPIEDHHGRVIGGKRSLDYVNKERSGEHGAWNMKEYSLAGALLARTNDLKLKDYVLCFIQRKRRVTKRATTGDDSEHGIETVICDDDQLINYGYLNNNKRARRSDEECNQPSNSGFRFGFNDDALDKPAVPKEVEQRDSSIFQSELDKVAKHLGVYEPTVMQDVENIATTLGNERPALDDEALKYTIDPSVCDDEHAVDDDGDHVFDSFVKDLWKGEQLPLQESEIEMLSNTCFEGL